MNEQQALSKMVPPGQRRPGKYMQGVVQIHVTRSCDKSCFNCTQGSNLGGKSSFISLEHFEQAVLSVNDYFGVVGVFGGNPALHPHFEQLCSILRKHIPFIRRGLWCNHPRGKGKIMRHTFNPSHSNLNVHQDQEAFGEFKRDWPESRPVGLESDSRHSPPYVAMKDVLITTCNECSGNGGYYDTKDGERYISEPIEDTPWTKCPTCNGTGKVYREEDAWELISNCDINKHWSAMIGVFRGQLRAWFCEIAGAQSILHQDDPTYPDTGLDPTQKHWLDGYYYDRDYEWWQLPMSQFKDQVRKHCHECGIPLRGYGELANAEDDLGKEQVSVTHKDIYKPKRKSRRVELVTIPAQLGFVPNITQYLQNSKV